MFNECRWINGHMNNMCNNNLITFLKNLNLFSSYRPSTVLRP